MIKKKVKGKKVKVIKAINRRMDSDRTGRESELE